MKIALELQPCSNQMSGIGHYTFQLAKRLFDVEGVSKPKLPHLERWFAEISTRPGFVKYLSAPMT